MKVVVHRGTHQIGGVATEFRTEKTRLFIDMGEEIGMEADFEPKPLSIDGVTNDNGHCDAVLFTHNHGDHVGQLKNIRRGIPLYMGDFSKKVLLATLRDASEETKAKIEGAEVFKPGVRFCIGDIAVTPFSIDHSACDSYMFLLEAEGKRILHTGDFRMHGLRGRAVPKLLEKLVRKVDVLVTEGTTLSRAAYEPMTEYELQQKVREYIRQYKYVFVLAATTNLERICALSKATPRGKYFICDAYQARLLDLIEENQGHYSPLYRDIKKTIYGENLIERFKDRGFVMMVRDNWHFRQLVPRFPKEQSIMLYSLWDGYRTKEGSTIPDFLELAGHWETLHTSGHASPEAIARVIELVKPEVIIPMHTECPEVLRKRCPRKNVVFLNDGQEYIMI